MLSFVSSNPDFKLDFITPKEGFGRTKEVHSLFKDIIFYLKKSQNLKKSQTMDIEKAMKVCASKKFRIDMKPEFENLKDIKIAED